MATQSYVDELVRDARLVADYSAAVTGRFNNALVAAIDAVENLPAPQRTSSAPAVVELSNLYDLARKDVEFRIFFALRGGWCVFPSKRQRRWTAVMVVAAIVFMICTLHLTRIYNRGVELSVALTSLEQNQSEIRFGELERRLLDAQVELGEGTPASAGGPVQANAQVAGEPVLSNAQSDSKDNERFILAREASHRLLNELVNLDQRVTTVGIQVAKFQQQARYPIVGQQSAEGYLTSLMQSGSKFANYIRGCPFGVESVDGICAFGGQPLPKGQTKSQGTFDPRSSGMRVTFCGKVGLLDDYANGNITKADLIKADSFLGDLAYSIDDSLGVDTAQAIVQSCALGLSFYSGAFPDIEVINMDVREALNLYSLIILPAMYGALGVIVYFLRAFLNPQEPNEGWSRTLYRIALGALAGMIMAWLGMGLLGTDDAFKSIGLGLFAFAFILGFSIDVFFDLLENLVKAARGSVRQIGSFGPGATPPTQGPGQPGSNNPGGSPGPGTPATPSVTGAPATPLGAAPKPTLPSAAPPSAGAVASSATNWWITTLQASRLPLRLYGRP